MVEAKDAAPVPPEAERPRRASAAAIAWCMVAGFFLYVAPRSPAVWNDEFLSWSEPLRDLFWRDGVRWAVSTLGILLLMAGTWELAGRVTARLRR